MLEEVVEHGRYSLHHDWMHEDGLDVAGKEFEARDRLACHDVVETREEPQVLVVGFGLLACTLLQSFPRARLSLGLLLLDLRHVLQQSTESAESDTVRWRL